MSRKPQPIAFATSAELRILSSALDDAARDAKDDAGFFGRKDMRLIMAMKARVDAELIARHTEKLAVAQRRITVSAKP